MRFNWSINILAPDGNYGTSGSLYANDLEEVITQVRTAVSAEYGSVPMYTGQRIKADILIENVATKP